MSNVPLTVDIILELDQKYRYLAEQDRLPKIAPKRNNPTGEAWLPIMTEYIAGARVSLLFSNTDRAHELRKTRDWVVLYYEKAGEKSQCTIVTSERGRLKGKRVIRGREKECYEYYESK